MTAAVTRGRTHKRTDGHLEGEGVFTQMVQLLAKENKQVRLVSPFASAGVKI